MTKAIQTKQQAQVAVLEKAIMEWDFAGLDETHRLRYLNSVCKECKLNIKLNPFTYIRFQGKVIPYLTAGGTAQLRSVNKISSKVVKREYDKENGILTVIVEVTSKDGRSDQAMGAMCISGLRGEALANAFMKCETKAKRRATLSLTGMLKFDTPTGEEEPIKQSESEIRTEEVEEKAIETSERPEFVDTLDGVVTAVESSELPPAEPSEEGYRMKSGTNKGKLLKDLSEPKLRKWLSWYEKAAQKGPVHPDVQDDAFQIQAILNGPQEEMQI